MASLKDLLYRRGIAYRCSGTDPHEIQLCCPYCPTNRGEHDTNFCLHINVKKNAGHCWHESCGFRSRDAVTDLLQELFGQAEEISGDEPEIEEEAKPVTLPDDFQLLTKIEDEIDQQALDYILNRGVTPEQVKKAHLGISLSGRYRYRVIFPVTDPDGMELYGLTARDWTGQQEPKYLTNPGPKYLFNFDPDSEVVILSEGTFKALRIGQVTSSCSASVLGHSLTTQQLSQIQTSKCRHVLIWPDPDKVGRKGAIKIADKLIEDWNGKVSIVMSLQTPADDLSLNLLDQFLFEKVEPYNWATAKKLSK